MRFLVLLSACFCTLTLGSCSSTKVVPATTAAIVPPTAPPPVEHIPARTDYKDSSSNGTLAVNPEADHTLVLEHITITGPATEGPGKPIIRLTIWQSTGESLEHNLEFTMENGRYVYDQDVFHRLQAGQKAQIDTFDPESGDVYSAHIMASGYQQTK